MLIGRRARDGILDGSITMLFRRWRRPQVVGGRRYRTTAGLLAVETVDVLDPADITEDDARAAGYDSAAAAVAELRGAPDLPVYRLRVSRVAQPDPRDTLAGRADLGAQEVADLRRRLDRLDRASSHGPWTAAVLAAIAGRPGVRAADLAAGFGRETQPFKTDVRKLKNLGLTYSLEVGYRLSPRGETYLRRSSANRAGGQEPPPRRGELERPDGPLLGRRGGPAASRSRAQKS